MELLIADDHPLFREALRGVVARAFPGTAILEADSPTRLYALVDDHPDADLLLLDLDMPGARGFSTLIHLRATQPQLPVVIVSAHEEPAIVSRAMQHGAAGFIPKSTDAGLLGQALQQVLDGSPWVPANHGGGAGLQADEQEAAARLRTLTPQQFRILHMIEAGKLNKQIAHELEVSEATVKAHMTAIMRKMGVGNRTQVAVVMARLGVLE